MGYFLCLYGTYRVYCYGYLRISMTPGRPTTNQPSRLGVQLSTGGWPRDETQERNIAQSKENINQNLSLLYFFFSTFPVYGHKVLDGI